MSHCLPRLYSYRRNHTQRERREAGTRAGLEHCRVVGEGEDAVIQALAPVERNLTVGILDSKEHRTNHVVSPPQEKHLDATGRIRRWLAAGRHRQTWTEVLMPVSPAPQTPSCTCGHTARRQRPLPSPLPPARTRVKAKHTEVFSDGFPAVACCPRGKAELVTAVTRSPGQQVNLVCGFAAFSPGLAGRAACPSGPCRPP